MIRLMLAILLLAAGTAGGQTTQPATRPGIEYNAHQRPDPADPRPRLPVIYEQDIWDQTLPREQRDALDIPRLRVAVRLVARASNIVVMDIEAPAWNDVRTYERWVQMLRIIKTDHPQLKIAGYNRPYGDYLRNIRQRNDWHRNWIWDVYMISTGEMGQLLDYACIALYPQPEDKTLADFKARASGNLDPIRRLMDKPVIVFLAESDDMPDWMPDAAKWLTEQGVDVAWWRAAP